MLSFVHNALYVSWMDTDGYETNVLSSHRILCDNGPVFHYNFFPNFELCHFPSLLSHCHAAKLVSAFVISRLDYCNAVQRCAGWSPRVNDCTITARVKFCRSSGARSLTTRSRHCSTDWPTLATSCGTNRVQNLHTGVSVGHWQRADIHRWHAAASFRARPADHIAVSLQGWPRCSTHKT